MSVHQLIEKYLAGDLFENRSRLNFRVQILDPDSGDEVVWEGKASEMLRDNDNDPQVADLLGELSRKRKGEWVYQGGGAGASFKVKRVS